MISLPQTVLQWAQKQAGWFYLAQVAQEDQVAQVDQVAQEAVSTTLLWLPPDA